MFNFPSSHKAVRNIKIRKKSYNLPIPSLLSYYTYYFMTTSGARHLRPSGQVKGHGRRLTTLITWRGSTHNIYPMEYSLIYPDLSLSPRLSFIWYTGNVKFFFFFSIHYVSHSSFSKELSIPLLAFLFHIYRDSSIYTFQWFFFPSLLSWNNNLPFSSFFQLNNSPNNSFFYHGSLI